MKGEAVATVRGIGEEPAAEDAPGSAPAGADISHNLNGQRLGRKGRDTRERILNACTELLADPDEAISMSAVARRASLGMTSLYNYFADLTELLLAVLEPVMATSESGFMALLCERWPNEELAERCHDFLVAYYGFWAQHSRLLHLRNSLADSRDERMLIARVRSSQPVITLVVKQMGGDPESVTSPATGMATVLMTGIERMVTVATDEVMTGLFGEHQRRNIEHYLRPQARLMEMAIRDTRAVLAGDPAR